MLKNNIKRLQAFATLALFLAPATALAQWTGGNDTGYANAGSAGLPLASVYDIISNTVSWLLAVLGFIAIMGFVISGIQYLTSAGDEGQIDTAKTNMKYSIIGVIVALMGFVVINAVDAWLNADAKF
ncbi:MAG: hypothetical protein ACEQSB_03405 [Undibacterium sp.]